MVRFLEAVPSLKAHAALTTAYAAGLRASETVSLKIADIDNGPEMVAWLKANSDARFLISPPSTDWYPGVAGAVYFGRLLAQHEYNGKKLASSIWLR